MRNFMALKICCQLLGNLAFIGQWFFLFIKISRQVLTQLTYLMSVSHCLSICIESYQNEIMRQYALDHFTWVWRPKARVFKNEQHIIFMQVQGKTHYLVKCSHYFIQHEAVSMCMLLSLCVCYNLYVYVTISKTIASRSLN